MQQTEPRLSYEKGRFKQTCGPCGAVFEVVVLGGPMAKSSQEDLEAYQCPECGRGYHCRGAQTPAVRLISGRTDGR